MSTIRAHWHHYRQAVLNGELYIMAGKGERAEHALLAPGFNVDAFTDLMDMVGGLPYFVIDEEILDTITEQDYLSTLLDMKRAGVFRLPFGTMMVELPRKWAGKKDGHDFVILRDRSDTVKPPWNETNVASGNGCNFYGMHFALCGDEQGDYAVFAPCTNYVDIEEAGTDTAQLRVGAALSGAFQLEAPGGFDEKRRLAHMMETTYIKSGRHVGMALFCAVLVLASRGLVKEVIETTRLNKSRGASRVQVPRHIYVHIGRVYHRGSPVSTGHVPRKSPRPHFVRGFSRRYYTGSGKGKQRTGPVVWKFHPAQWVAWHGEETQAEMEAMMLSSMPTYDVRR